MGLAGFGLTTLILQFHNLGLCEIGPIVVLGLIFGGLAQMIAGFILLDLVHFGYSVMTKVAAWVLILFALYAWYMMAHVIYRQVFGRDVLPVGKPWLDPKQAVEPQLQSARAR